MTSRYRVPLLMLTWLTLMAETVCAAASPDAAARPAFTWQFEYDAADRITRLTDAANRSITLHYEEDDHGHTTKLTKHFFDDTTVTYQFDRAARPTSMADTTGTVHYAYDSAQRLSTVTRQGQPDMVYGYDTLDRLTSVRLGDRFAVRYTYDFLGRLKTMDTPAGTVAYDYHPAAAARVRTLPNGIQTTWRYQPNGSLRSITHAQNKHVLARYIYRYGADGLIQEVEETDTHGSATVMYAYDAQQQLIRATHSATGVTAFSYDPLGNRLRVVDGQSAPVSSTYDWAGRLMTVAGQAYRHTDVGSLASYTADHAARELHYNAANLVAGAMGPEAQVTYRYDGEGNLVERQVGQSTVQFLVNPLDPIWRPLQASPSHGPTTSYVWEKDTPLMAITGTRVVFFLHDHLGSVRYSTDDRGQISRRMAYAPFGVPQQPPEPHTLQPAFAGLFFDPDTRLYVTAGRSYSPHLGRFAQVDPQHRLPYGSPEDLSPYTYSGNDPVNYVDRTRAARECVNLACTSWQEAIKGWELGRQRRLSEATAAQIQIEAGQRIRDAALDKLDPLLKEGEINSRIVRDIIKDRLTTETDKLIKGKRVTAKELIQALAGETQAAGDAGLLSQEQVQKVIGLLFKANMETWEKTTRKLLLDFGRTSRSLQNVFRQQLGLGPSNLAMREARAAAVSIKKAADVFATGLEAAETVAQYVDLVGKSMMAMNPAVYLTHRTPLGLQGYGSAPLAGGTYRWSEVLHTAADRWWQRGDIQRVHWDRLDTGMGRYERGLVQHTPATSPMERFMMHWYPVGSYYDPDRTVERRTTRVTEHYRVHAVGGQQEVIGLMEHRSEPVSTPDGPHLGGGPSGGGGPRPPAAMLPAPVGGVYLSGAGEALKDLGTLTGVAIDDTSGRLVLLADNARRIALPPLDMETIVAIFRNVYLHGEAPFVSIDPDPNDPHGPEMFVRHSPETAASYAGWILFEADRVMKTYGLGVDNVSRQPIASRVPGYQSMLALGFTDPSKTQQTVWERFWIRPAAVTRRTSDTQRLTLVDVPLEVQTQRMVLEQGKLVPAPDPTPSDQARQFSAWFTQHYDEIATENQASSPAGTLVHFYAELRRLALIAAMAERLRDQGVPLPAWMQDYPVKRLALTPTTPALVVEGSQTETKQHAEGPSTRVITTTRQARLYGGVRLAPEDKDVRTVQAVPQARQLEADLARAMAKAPAVGTVELDSQGTTYTAAVLPGDHTRSVGANRLEVTDLTVPVEGETRIGLTRTFHSFFNPHGMLGAGWSMDLPRLEPRPQPVQRADDRTHYRMTFQLTSPLGSWSVAFREMKRFTGEVNGELMVPEHAPEILGLASGTDPRLGVPAHQVLWRDGRRWYFDQDGALLAWSEPWLFAVYRRDKAHRVQHIEGWHGDQRRAEIHLDYDADGRLTQARGSDGSTAIYTYDTPGRLASVSATSGDAPGRKTVTVAYAYHERLVTEIRQDGDVVQAFAYNAQGQLIWERRGNGQATVYTIDTHGGQTTMTAHGPGAEHRATQTVYDAALRPVQSLAADGTTVEWQYASNGEMATTVIHPDRTTTRLTRSADGRQTTWTLAAGGTQSITRDPAGRLTRLTTTSGNTVQQEWRPDGRLAMAAQDGLAMQPHYQADGRLTEVLLFPPSQAKAQQLDTWLRVEVDAQGRPTTISDYTGMRTTLGYDATGTPSVRLATVDGQQQGVQLTRDDQGRVTAMESSWGTTQQRRYGDTGHLAELTMRQSVANAPAQQARIQFDGDKIRHLTTFHGEEFAVSYATQGPHTGQIERVQLPNQLALQYRYDTEHRLAAIAVGSSYQLQYSYDAQGRLARVTQAPVQP